MSDELKTDGTDGTPAAARAPAADARSSYRVRLELFEGPLDLLLHLIKRDEVDVRELPVAHITEQYLSYLDLMRELNLDIAGEYLVMAATLTLLKSRLLLPSPGPEEGEEADLRVDLVRQLLEYQRYREAAAALSARPWLRRDTFVRESGTDGLPPDAGVPPLRPVTVWELMEALRAVFKRAQPDAVHHLDGERVSLRDRVAALLQTLAVARSVSFDSLFGARPARSYVIVTFLAVLELVKQQVVEAVQEAVCGPIIIALAVDDVSGVTIDLLEEYDGTASGVPDTLAEE